jgi:ABC-type branched-subunit amino acid transport system substrate-binding protein
MIKVNFILCIAMMLLIGCGGESNTSPPTAEPDLPESSQTSSTGMGGISEDEIVIGMSAAFKGPAQGLGIELYRGSMAYIKEINKAGGVHGRQIVMHFYDDGYNPTPAIENTIKLVEEDDVFLLFDYVGTPTVTRVLPLLSRYKDKPIYLFFPFTGAQPQREAPYDEFVFNLRASYRQETAGLVDNFVKLNRKRIGVFYQADAYGQSGSDGVKRALSSYGLEIVGEATYTRNTPFEESYAEQVKILKEANAEAIIMIGAYQACAGFIRDARDDKWDVPIANVSFVGSESLLNLLSNPSSESGLDYTINLINSQVVPSYEDTSLPAVKEYRELMDEYASLLPEGLSEEEYESLPYSFVSFEGFLNAKLLVEILLQMGEHPEREGIRATVESIQDLDLGIDVPISFDSNTHQGLQTIYYTTVKDEHFVPIKEWEEWAK